MIKYARDDRYSDEGVATHDRQISSAISATTLKQTRKEASKHGVIGIDEGQFVSCTQPILDMKTGNGFFSFACLSVS